MPQHNGKKDRFDLAFDKRFNLETSLLTPESAAKPTDDSTLLTPTDDRFDQALNLRFEQSQQAAPELTELVTPAGDVPPLSQGAEGFSELPETPLTPDQEFSQIVSPDISRETQKKPSFFSRVKEAFLKVTTRFGEGLEKKQQAENVLMARAKKKAGPRIKKLGTLLRKAAQQPVGPGGMTAEDVIGVVETGFGREVLRRKVGQAGDIIKKHLEGKLEAKDVIDFFRPDKNLKDFWEELQKTGREGAVFGVTLDDKEVPKEQQFRSFVTEFNKLAFEDIDLPPSVEIPITPLGVRGPTLKLKTLVTILGFSAEVLDPSILGVNILGKAFKVKELTAIQKALKAGDDLAETQVSALLKMDEALGIAGKERAEADLIKEIEGFGVETPSGPALEFDKPGRFKRVQAEEIPEPGVSSLAARIARDEEGFSAEELEIQTNFPEEIEAEFKSLRKGEDLAPDEPLPTLTREDVENQVRELGFSEEQTNAQLKLFEARAKAWAQQTGRPADEWYGERIAGIKRSVPEDLPGQVRNEPPERVETAVEGDEVFINENDELTINGRVLFQDPAFSDISRATYQVIVRDRGGTARLPSTGKQSLVSTGVEGTEEIRPGVFRVPGLTQVHYVRGEKAAKAIFKDNTNLGFQVEASQIGGLQSGREFKSIDDFESDAILQTERKPLRVDLPDPSISPNILFQKPDDMIKDSSPIFYSTLRNTIEDKMPGRADVTTIRGLVKNIKKEEIQWSGLDDYLAGREGDKITKDEVLDFLKENQIRIEETLKGANPDVNVVRRAELAAIDRERPLTPGEQDEFDELSEFTGGFNSERMVIELEDNGVTSAGGYEIHKIENEIPSAQGERRFRITYDVVGPDGNVIQRQDNARDAVEFVGGKVDVGEPRHGEYQLPGGDNYKEMLLRLPVKKSKRVERIRRISDRVAELKSNKDEIIASEVLSTEEKGRQLRNIQTQIDLAIRESEFTIEEIAARGGPTPELFRSAHWEEPNVLAHVRFNERTIVKPERFSVPEKTLFIEEIQSDWMQTGRKQGFQKKTGVPDAPFKTTWHEMSMRRMIRYAADNNFDRIGWTTGVQQVERYPEALRQAVDKFSWTKADEAGDKFVQGFKNDERVFSGTINPEGIFRDGPANGKALSEVIGNEMAEQIITTGGGNILGKDFTIGGEGMKFFYDKMLVNYAKKFGKKFGAEVEDVNIPHAKQDFVSAETGEIVAERPSATIHSMKITEEMKRSVREKGVPLFQDAKGAVEFLEGEQRAIIHLFEGADFSTILHETAHIFRRELVSADLIKAEKWAGVRDGNWTTEAEEKFARAFERYLREGEAPNPELKKIFEQFKEWLKEIYRVIKGGDIDVNLNDNIRQVFDNLLGGKELGDFTGKTARAPAVLPGPIADIIGGADAIRMRPNTDFFKGKLREEIVDLRRVLHRKFPGKKIFVDQGGESLDEIAAARGITEDELRQELLNIGTEKDKFETFRAQAEEAFQRPVTVNSKGELVIDGTVLFQRPKPTPVKGGKPQERLDLEDQAQIPKGKIKTKPFKKKGTFFEKKADGSQGVLFQEAPGLSPGQRKKAIGKLQIEKFSEEAKGVIEESIKVFGKDIRAQRRGKRSIAVTKQAATQEKQLIIDALNGKIKEGTAFNAEKIEALGGAVEDIATKLAKDTKLMDNPVTMHLFTNLFKTFSGAASEAGRGLRQLREVRAGLDFDVFKTIKKKAVELDAEISKIIDKEVPPPSLMNKIVEFSRNVKLMAASSLVRSFAGNLSMQMFKFAETGISPVYNKVLSALTGKSQDRFIRELAADFMGMKAGISEGLQSARGILVENSDALAESAFLQREFGKTMRAISGTKGKIIRIGQNAQGAIDAIFRVPAIEGRIRVHVWRQALQENLTGSELFKRVDELIEDIPSDKKLMERILEEARQQTFQKQLGSIGSGINAARQAEGGILQLIVPFFNTAANLFKEFVARTPLALVTKSFWMDASKMWKPGEIGLASDALAKITSGTLFSFTVYIAVNEIFEGRIIGRGPSSLNERNLLRESGWLPYSIRIGDTYRSYLGFEPISSFLGALADFHEGKKEGGLIRGFSKAFENVAATFADNPFLQGISDTADLLQGRKNLNQYLTQLAVGMLMPSIVRQTAKVIDPTLKVKRDGSLTENIRDGFVAVTPWLSKNLEDRYSPLGKKIVRQNALGNLFAIKISKESNDLVVKELVSIGFFPGSGSRYQNINLTEKEKNELNEIAGKQLYKSILMFLSNPEWKTLDKADKVKIIRRTKNKIFDVQKSMLFGESGELLTNNPKNKSLTSAQLKLKKNQRLLSKR